MQTTEKYKHHGDTILCLEKTMKLKRKMQTRYQAISQRKSQVKHVSFGKFAVQIGALHRYWKFEFKISHSSSEGLMFFNGRGRKQWSTFFVIY